MLRVSGRRTGPNIRYAVLYRLTTANHPGYGQDPQLGDPWVEWPALGPDSAIHTAAPAT